MQIPTTEKIIEELRKQQVAEKYFPEGISAVINCMESCERSLEQAVAIIARYAALNDEL